MTLIPFEGAGEVVGCLAVGRGPVDCGPAGSRPVGCCSVGCCSVGTVAALPDALLEQPAVVVSTSAHASETTSGVDTPRNLRSHIEPTSPM